MANSFKESKTNTFREIVTFNKGFGVIEDAAWNVGTTATTGSYLNTYQEIRPYGGISGYISSGDLFSNSIIVATTGNQTISGTKRFIDTVQADEIVCFSTQSKVSIENEELWDAGSESVTLNWGNLFLSDGSSSSLNWSDRILYDDLENVSIDWTNREIRDSDGLISIDYQNRQLKIFEGSLNITTLDWDAQALFGQWTVNNGLKVSNSTGSINNYISIVRGGTDWRIWASDGTTSTPSLRIGGNGVNNYAWQFDWSAATANQFKSPDNNPAQNIVEVKGAASQVGAYFNVSSNSAVGDIFSIKTSGVGIKNYAPRYTLDVSGSGNFSNGIYDNGKKVINTTDSQNINGLMALNGGFYSESIANNGFIYLYNYVDMFWGDVNTFSPMIDVGGTIYGTPTIAGFEIDSPSISINGNPLTVASTVISDSNTGRTLTDTDAQKYIRFTSNSAVSITVPSISLAGWNDDTEIFFEQAGSGQLTMVSGAGVTINSSSSLKSFGRYSVIAIKMVASNVWTLMGDRM